MPLVNIRYHNDDHWQHSTGEYGDRVCTRCGVHAVTDKVRSFVNVQVFKHLGNSVFQGHLHYEIFLCIAGSYAGFQLCFGLSASPTYVACVFFKTYSIYIGM